MAAANEEWIDIVGALIKLTQTGQLRWAVTSPSEAFNVQPEGYVENVYTTKYEDSLFRLYEEVLSSNKFQFSPLKVLRANAPKDVVLEIVDDGRRSLWRFPPITALNDLLASVKYQVSDVKKVFDSLVKEAKKATE